MRGSIVKGGTGGRSTWTTQVQGENLFDWPVRKGTTQRQTHWRWLSTEQQQADWELGSGMHDEAAAL